MVQTGPDEVAAPADLVRQADELMYVAKKRAKEDGAHHLEFEQI